MSALYDRLAASPTGARALSVARLRDEILGTLHEALDESGISKAQLANVLGVRRSAVNEVFNGDGNIQVDTIARYLHELGKELMVEVVPLGEPRRRAEEEMRKLDVTKCEEKEQKGTEMSRFDESKKAQSAWEKVEVGGCDLTINLVKTADKCIWVNVYIETSKDPSQWEQTGLQPLGGEYG